MDKLAVVGLGYVGLPLAVLCAERGYKVCGIDIKDELVAQINKRELPYTDDKRLGNAMASLSDDALKASTSYNDVSTSQVVVICVPTPTRNGVPDTHYVVQATEQIASQLKPGQLVVVESTVSPGMTRNIVLPILEDGSGLKVGKDFYLAHCPERIDPGNKEFFVGNLNRVVGGITKDCTKQAVEFYSSIIDAKVMPMSSPEEAEFVKSWENSHRNVMIALANNAAIICDALNMDIVQILKGLQSKVDQFGLSLAWPGIGPGGHCIPEDIHYVIERARQNGVDTRLLDNAADLNDSMPQYAVRRLAEMVSERGEDLRALRVALLGLAYKPNVADVRRSPSIEVLRSLLDTAHSVVVHDPYVTNRESGLSILKQAVTLDDALRNADVVFVGTAHALYEEKLDVKLLTKHGIRFVFDGRNMLDKTAIVAAGIGYRGIGR